MLQSGWFLRAAETRAFESEFAARTNSPYCVLVANGYDALRLTLRAWISLRRLEAGDEVIVPANSFIASALAVTDAGLQVRLADVEPGTFNVSAASVAAAMTPRTRVVMPVHLYGQLADIEPIRALCAKNNLLLLEDAAQAHGARLGATSAGMFGDAGAYSFYPAKNLGALGDSGCLVTADPALAVAPTNCRPPSSGSSFNSSTAITIGAGKSRSDTARRCPIRWLPHRTRHRTASPMYGISSLSRRRIGRASRSIWRPAGSGR